MGARCGVAARCTVLCPVAPSSSPPSFSAGEPSFSSGFSSGSGGGAFIEPLTRSPSRCIATCDNAQAECESQALSLREGAVPRNRVPVVI